MPLSRQELISKLSSLVEKESKMLASTPPPLTDTLDIELSIEDMRSGLKRVMDRMGL